MKKNIWLFTVASIFGIITFFTACKKDAGPGNQVFLNQSVFLPFQRLVLDQVSTLTIPVSTSYPVNNDVSVNIKADTTLLSVYNIENNTKLKPVPAGYYQLSSGTATINKGNARGSVVLTIKAWPDYDSRSRYALPLKLTSVNGEVSILTASSIVYVLLDKVVNVKAAIGQFEIPDVTKGVVPSEYTVEGSFQVLNAGYNCSDPYSDRISTILASNRALSVYSANSGEGSGSFRLRVGGGVDVNDITYGTRLVKNDWRHFAYTLKAGIFSLYVNGELIGTKASTALPMLDFAQLGCGNNYAFSEVRVWSKARTQAQISDNMCGTDPNDPNLLAYWSFTPADQTAPNSFTDLTKNKFIAVRKSSGTTQFVDGRCPN